MMKKQVVCIALIMVSMATILGCRSFSSVLMFRNECNSQWDTKRLLHGVPVTLKVPTHVKIDIKEKSYIVKNASGEFEHYSPAKPLFDVEHSFIENDKVFLVDLKRPAAGSLNATIDLDPESQYFNKISREYTDTTIEAVTGLLGAAASNGLFGAPTTERKKNDSSGKNFTIEKTLLSTVASDVFEIDAPDFEVQVSEFLGLHLNNCHSCGLEAACETCSPAANYFVPGQQAESIVGPVEMAPAEPLPEPNAVVHPVEVAK